LGDARLQGGVDLLEPLADRLREHLLEQGRRRRCGRLLNAVRYLLLSRCHIVFLFLWLCCVDPFLNSLANNLF
jgi:hypothetical protein